jgi:hypothetical protein
VRYSHGNARLTSGTNTSVFPGFLTAGFLDTVVGLSGPLFYVDRTHKGGGVGTQAWEFQKGYSISADQDCITATPNTIGRCGGVKVIETSISSNTYALVASIPHGIVFCLLHSDGSVGRSAHYYLPGAGYTPSRRLYIVESSASPGTFFIIAGTNGNEIHIIKINSSGTLLNSYAFNALSGLDPWAVIESPYGSKDITIIGQIDNGSDMDGFFYQIDQSLNPITSLKYDDNGAFEVFASINIANSTAPGSSGFIIGGNYEGASPPNQPQPLFIKVDQIGGIIWQNATVGTFDSNGGPVSGVFERLNQNPTPKYEYFGVITCSLGIMVQRLDASGQPWSFSSSGVQDEYLYDITGTIAAVPVALTNNSSGVADVGIHIYGYDEGDFYFVEAYYSGESGCGQRGFINNSTAPNSTTLTFLSSSITPAYECSVPTVTIVNSAASSQTCGPYTSIGGASNSRSTNLSEEIAESKIIITPNPVEDKIRVIYSKDIIKSAKVTLLDISGKEIRTYQISDNPSTRNELEIVDLDLAPGVYFVELTNGGNKYVQKMILTK